MFQTEPILALQSAAPEWLVWLMRAVTAMGYSPFYVTLLLFVFFVVHHRCGFALMQLAVYNAFVTDAFKELLSLPRPVGVDPRVLDLSPEGLSAPRRGLGAAGPLSLLPSEAVEHFRATRGTTPGFPSGHSSSAVTTWGGLSLLFPRRWLRVFSIVIVVLMPVSRVLLGRHFIADVLGGLALGVLGLLVFFLWNRWSIRRSPLTTAISPIQIAFLLGAPVLLIFFPGAEPHDIGRLWGLNVGYVLLVRAGLPSDGASLVRRLGRFAIGVGCYLGVVVAVTAGFEARLGGEAVETLAKTLAGFFTIYGGVTICRRLGLYGTVEERAGRRG